MRLPISLIAFDPRSKLATVILASFFLTVRVHWKVEMVFVFFMFLLLTLNGAFKKGVVFCLIYVATLFCEFSFVSEITGPITSFLSFFIVVTQLLIPPIMAATFCMNQTKMSQWIAAMKKMHIPLFIVIPFSVVCRFFPVLLQDFRQIRKTMKFRGIGINSVDMFTHPLLTMEYILVPILSSVEMSAMDLSAAALIRGLGSKTTTSSVYDNQFNVQDYLLLFAIILFLCVGGLI